MNRARRASLISWVVLISSNACFSPDAEVQTASSGGGDSTTAAESNGVDAGPATTATTAPEATSEATTAPTSGTGQHGADSSGSESGTTGRSACGDGVQDQGEACDDGNQENGDGCSRDCHVSGALLWEVTYDGEADDRAQSLSINQDDEVLIVGKAGEDSARVCSDWFRLFNSDGESLQSGETPVDYCSVAFIAADRYAGVRSATFENQGATAAGEFALAAHDLAGEQIWSSDLDYVREVGRVAQNGGRILLAGSAGTDSSSIFVWSVGYVLEVSNGSELWEDGFPNTPPPTQGAFARYECGPVASYQGARFSVCDSEDQSSPELHRFNSGGGLLSTTPFAGEGATIAGYAMGVDTHGTVAVAAYDEVFVFDPSGTEHGHFTYSGTGDVHIHDILIDGEANLLLAGNRDAESGGGARELFLRKTSQDGTLLWELARPTPSTNPSQAHIELFSDDSIAFFGAESAESGADLWLARVAP